MDVSAWKSDETLVEINVGGRLFETTRETLTKYQGTFFSARLSGQYSAKDGANKFKFGFIDRSPVYFEVILDFLRTGKVDWGSNMSEKMLREEAQFYGLEEVMFGAQDNEERTQEIEETVTFPLNKTANILIDNQEIWSPQNVLLTGSVTWMCEGTCDVTLRIVGFQPISHDEMVFHPSRLMQGNMKRMVLFERTESVKIIISGVTSDPACSGVHALTIVRTKEVEAACVRTKKRKLESE